MFKFIAAPLLALALMTTSCASPQIELVEEVVVPTHEYVYFSPSDRILNISCEKTCILTVDSDGNFVATMVDGSTVTFAPDSE
jgi:hypothetical protein